MSGVPIARLLGFEIRVHPSWIVIIALVAVLVVGEFETAAPDSAVALRWLIGGLTAAAFLVSVLAHELAHGVVARRRGLDVGPITLYFFGGSGSYQLESDRPRDEAAIALAGPLVSLAIGGALAVGAYAGDASGHPILQTAAPVALLLAVLNLVLGGANLVPAYPLDGGRVVRALVWARQGDERAGARAAAASGRLVGWGLVAAGVVLIAMNDAPDGIMLALSGWFLGNASRGILRRLVVEDLLRGVRVSDVMETDVSSIPPSLTVDTFAAQLLDGSRDGAMPVMQDSRVLGLVGAAQVRRLRRGAWPTTRAEDVMVAPPRLPFAQPDDQLWAALDRLRRSGLDGLPVVEGAGLLGIVSRRAIVAMIQSRAQSRGVSLR